MGMQLHTHARTTCKHLYAHNIYALPTLFLRIEAQVVFMVFRTLALWRVCVLCLHQTPLLTFWPMPQPVGECLLNGCYVCAYASPPWGNDLCVMQWNEWDDDHHHVGVLSERLQGAIFHSHVGASLAFPVRSQHHLLHSLEHCSYFV